MGAIGILDRTKTKKKKPASQAKPNHLSDCGCAGLQTTEKTITPKAGNGACSACGCMGFRINPNNYNDYYCYDCGHHWDVHG